MGRPRKNTKQKNDARQANAANMQFLEESQQIGTPESDKRREKSVLTKVPPSKKLAPKQPTTGANVQVSEESKQIENSESERIREEPEPSKVPSSKKLAAKRRTNAANMQFSEKSEQNATSKTTKKREKTKPSMVPAPKQLDTAKTEPPTSPSNSPPILEKADRVKSERRKIVNEVTSRQTSEFQVKESLAHDDHVCNSRAEMLPLNLSVVQRTVVDAHTEEEPSCSYSLSFLKKAPENKPESLSDNEDECSTVVTLSPISTNPRLAVVSERTGESADGKKPYTTSSTMAPSSGIGTPSTSSSSSTIEQEQNQTDDSIEAPNENVDASQAELNKLQVQINSLQKELEEVRKENKKLRILNMKHQEETLSKTIEAKFTEIDGFPDADWLLSASQSARDSDYIFVKELLIRLFPGGVGNATVTGRCSNNPHGRVGGSGPIPNRAVEKLDAEKVNYIKERLFERRRILQDPIGVAQQLSRNCTKHISTAIANNPSLRRTP